MGSSSPANPTSKWSSKQALKGLETMFGQPKGSFKSILDAQPFFNQLQSLQLGDTITQLDTIAGAKVALSQKTEGLLKEDSGLLGQIYKEGLQGPGLSQSEQQYFSQQIGAQQAARGVYGSPVSAFEAGGLLGMYGIQRQTQRQDRALQLLSAMAPPSFGPSPQFNVPGNFNTQQQAALQGYGMYTQAQSANNSAYAQAFQGLGQAAGMYAGMYGATSGAATS